MQLRKTKFGGLFTIIFIMVAFMLISVSVLTFYLDNVTEEKALVPLAIIQKDYDEVTADITIITTFISYGGTCVSYPDGPCHPKILWASDNIINGKETPIVCTKEDNDCTITYKCTDCEVETGGVLNYDLSELNSYATEIAVNITTTSSIPDENSFVSKNVKADSNTVFRGPIATRFPVLLTPSVFEETAEN